MKIYLFIGLFLCFGLMNFQVRAETALKKIDLTVAADGSGDVRTINEALEKVPENNKTRFTIFIKKGIYDGQIRIPSSKPFVSFIGEAGETTIIRYDLNNKHAGTTSAAYAVYIGGHDFHAENLTFQNSYDYKANTGTGGTQAVAVSSEADRLIFKNCKFLGFQDTLYAKGGRQYFENCYIEGNVDFIFGQAAAVFDKCVIHSKGDGYIAAPMRFSADEASGYVFIDSKLTGENIEKGVFLGRPWRAYGRTIFLNTEMDAHIRAEGWNNWGNKENEKTAYFAEFNSKGAGAKPESRVKWIHQISKEEAKQFETENFLKGKDGWNPKSSTDEWLEKTQPDWNPVSWNRVFDQIPLWYQTDDAARIADQVCWYQKTNGGWEKNIDMAAMLTGVEKANLLKNKVNAGETTIDNRATYEQIRFLAVMITASLKKTTPPNNFPWYKESFNHGLDFLLASQYQNGGFPQYFPLKTGYYTHITFNDDAMIGVLNLLRDVAEKREDFVFVDEERRSNAKKAIERALPVLLKTQIKIGSKKTIWAQQYDENTLKPAPARTFEPIALSAGESVGIVRYLMRIEKPNPQIVQAIESAIKWFKKNELKGIRWEHRNGENRVVKDKNAPPIWARFYQIETMKPIFVGRDSVIKYDVSEIEAERRNGYAWYVSAPQELLEKDYLKWKERIKK
ncbi:MAG TPA: pectate lyase [Pyrinomonadaceae bacterium]|nr:pectate lyase [Pyrinomonadaceae bacterium]